MIVHLVASLRDPEVDLEYIDQVIEVIHDQGGVLAHNWIDAALIRKKENIEVPDWGPYVEDNLDAVKRAHVVIADLTHYSFSQGFLVAAALEHKKPVLAISRTPLKGMMISGLSDPLFTYKEYATKDDLAKTVRTFIGQNTVHTKDLRFNMFLTRSIFKYLEEASRETGKNKSEVIRDIIKRKTRD